MPQPAAAHQPAPVGYGGMPQARGAPHQRAAGGGGAQRLGGSAGGVPSAADPRQAAADAAMRRQVGRPLRELRWRVRRAERPRAQGAAAKGFSKAATGRMGRDVST